MRSFDKKCTRRLRHTRISHTLLTRHSKVCAGYNYIPGVADVTV